MKSGRSVAGGLLSVGLLVGACAPLGACSKVYTADLRNRTSQPVGVAVLTEKGVLGRGRIGPGDRGQVSGRTSASEVFVEVDTLGNPGYPARMPLLPGLNVADVTQEAASGRSAIALEPAPR